MDSDAMLPIEDRDRIAPDLLHVLARHVSGDPGLSAIERGVELIAAGPEVVRARDHVLRIGGINFDVRLVVRKRVVAIETHVSCAARSDGALDLRVRAMLLVEAGDVDGPLRRVAFRETRPRLNRSGQSEAEHECEW